MELPKSICICSITRANNFIMLAVMPEKRPNKIALAATGGETFIAAIVERNRIRA